MDETQQAGVNMVIAIIGVAALIVFPPASLPEILRWALVAFFVVLALDSVRRWTA